MTAVDVAPRTAWIDGVNPVTKVAMVVVLALPLLISVDAVSAAVALVLELLCVPFTGLAYRVVAKRLVPVLLFAPVAAVSMLLYARPGGTVYGTFLFATISDDSLALSFAVLLRVVALALPMILLFARTDPTELADALAQVAKLPSRFVLGVLAGARTVGLFVDDWRTMTLARRARGLGDRGALRRFFSMAFVLLVFAVRRGTTLATAMEARGFGADVERTWSRPSRLHPRDAVALAGSLALVAVALTAAVVSGAFRVVGT
ncbi:MULTISPECIES: energy-coupling factor transporter transmembrane protein EcfT [Microbacterium]|jgi:energy-coupling factor transport system permease protein|uniref:energy-coupling factor transporter transmembrane component T family protein n=1 Tax=Microbacterium TaxID=33882 RepID=UPI002783B802|nr:MULTISPECIES: energy-coupling factor transporter transmembrane component T [Microbacterium]MDQ1075350.1 energy-coupling factor transport system permease protein [Microbacterium sp. SORGH_AS_0969]MDQ1115581.1 energy-coupling factor transport system permease protein [Microbacterium testaceum]